MRISDWSSDVCSSDLTHYQGRCLDGKACILGKFFEGSAPRDLILRIGQKIRHCLSRLLIGEDLYNLLTRRRQRLRWSGGDVGNTNNVPAERSEEHTSELQSLMRISYAVFCLKKKKKTK